eukprot:1451317-Alexandrium_andersonii.AAC.1
MLRTSGMSGEKAVRWWPSRATSRCRRLRWLALRPSRAQQASLFGASRSTGLRPRIRQLSLA